MRRFFRTILLLVLASGRSDAASDPEPPPEAGRIPAEIDRMASALYKTREEAFETLSAWARRHAGTREALWKAALAHADLEVRERARMILEETELDFTESAVGVPGIAGRLRSDDLKTRFDALLALPRTREAFPILKRFVRDPQIDPQLRSVALELAARIPLAETAQLILAVAREPANPSRERAVYWLGRLRIEAALPLLVAAARDPGDPARLAACHALATLGDPAAAPVFREIIQDLAAPENVKVMALVGSAKLADAKAVPLLAVIARGAEPAGGASPTVRVFAVRALGRIQDPRATELLVGLVAETTGDPLVRREACLALGEQHAPEGLAPLAAAVADGRLPLHARKAAVAALRRLTGWSVEGTVDAQALFYQGKIAR